MSTDTFQYILIPSDSTQAIKALEGSKSGGLQDDKLVKNAKEYFSKQSGSAATAIATAAAIDRATPEERKDIAEQIRKKNPGSEKFDDDFLIQMFKTSQSSSSCEIHALTVPTPVNGQIGVSMYSADDAKTRELPPNVRAMELMRACGHAHVTEENNAICGDVFVGRYHDDEKKDIWDRVDLTVDDVTVTEKDSAWCKLAKKAGGGGGSGKATGSAPSLSGMMTKTMQQQQGAVATNTNNTTTTADGDNVGGGGAFHWSQTDEEVELRFNVAPGTKAKYVKVAFSRTSLKVVVAGQTLVNGETGGDVAVGDSTYTIQDGEAGKKELTVTLGKKGEGLSWNYAVLAK